jgi:CRISPR-associated protein Csd1
MLNELIEKAEKLEFQGELPPIGYRINAQPIKWIVYLYPDNNKEPYIKSYSGDNRPVPSSSQRTSGCNVVYPFCDESSYVLGIEQQKGGEKDKNADKKHQAYKKLLNEMLQSLYFTQPLLQEAVSVILDKLKDGSIRRAFMGETVYCKDLITFIYQKEYLENKFLHEIPETQAFWMEKLSQDVTSSIKGQCNVCNKEKNIVKNIPTKVTLSGSARQISSYNKNSFVSFRYGQKGAPLGLCLSCAEKSSQVLNYLLKNNCHKIIYEDKSANGKVNSSSTRNQIAVYWLKNDINLSIGEQEFDIIKVFQIPLTISSEIKIETTEALITDFLTAPWIGKVDTLQLDDNTFYLAILSPNGKGRIAIREWLHTAAKNVRNNLYLYFLSLKLVSLKGQKGRPYTIPELLASLEDVDPNMVKTLIRSAYMGAKPSYSLFQAAINQLRIVVTKNEEQKNKFGIGSDEAWQRLCTIIKFYLSFRKEESEKMCVLNVNDLDTAYQSGRLLAALEEIQRRASTGKLSSTLVERYYGSVSTSPAIVFPVLINMATKAHLPKIRKNNRGYNELENLVGEIMSKIDNAGGFDKTLVINRQGLFALGFYHQRAELNAKREEHYKKLRGLL